MARTDGPITATILVIFTWLVSTGCVFGFDTTVPESGEVDEGEGVGVDAADGADLGDAPDLDADGDAADGDDGAPDADAAAPTDADASGVDVDVTPSLRCADLDCDANGRVCDEGDVTTDARCGQCLSGFIQEGEACAAPDCLSADDCVPDPAAIDWSTCGGYADACAREGTQTRLVYTGDCVGGRCEVTSVEQTRVCPDLRVTDGNPCVVDAAVGECRSGTCAVVPGQVAGVSASDGTSTDLVRVTWSAVDGATGYHVYRNGERLTVSPLTSLSYEDRSAPAGGVPAQVTGLSATAATDRITLTWTAAAGTGTPGVAATYTVTALNATGEGPASAGDAGNRAGFALSGYEVRINGSGSWLSAGTSTSYADTSAPAGSVSVTNVSASDGTSTAHVTLSATTAPGASRSYEVRAVNAAGGGTASAPVSAQRSVGTPSVQWQRSSGTTASGFSDISGATSALYDDTGAPSDGSVRHYRVVASASGAATVTSSSDSGFRQISLGATCNTDSQCPSGSWCSTVSGFRRCSPRLFGGQSHQMDFVYVPAGTFAQGTTGATNEERPYTATLTRNYFVSRTEVTQGQWKAATGATNPSCFQTTSGTSCGTTNAFNAGPVERVDWYSALAYANWLSSQNGLQQCYTLSGCSSASTGWQDGQHDGCTGATFTGLGCTGYRLLTESEWERAARGGTTSTYYWGEATDTSTVGQYAWFSGNTGSRTQGVGQKVMNAYGLYDMSGNVWEWVWDWYASSYPSGSATDYTGPSTGSFRGDRGGSWSSSASNLRSADRLDNGPANRNSNLGVRLARTLP
jgi:sulfatase modifying factor 1